MSIFQNSIYNSTLARRSLQNAISELVAKDFFYWFIDDYELQVPANEDHKKYIFHLNMKPA